MVIGHLRAARRPLARTLVSRSPTFSSTASRFTSPNPDLSSLIGLLHLRSPWIPAACGIHSLTDTRARLRPKGPIAWVHHVPDEPLPVSQPNKGSLKERNVTKLRKLKQDFVVGAETRRTLNSKITPAYYQRALLHSHATSFGFKDVREEEKSRLVGNVFSSVASSYDLMNDLMSGGLHRLWKDRLVSDLNPYPGMKHLDVAGGTGDVAFRILEQVSSIKHRALQDASADDLQDETKIYVCDINPNMLNVGKKRATERGLAEQKSLVWVEGDAEALSFDDKSMDGYTIAFGIRNVTHIEKVIAEAYRVLKPGGRFLCLELSHVEVPVFKELYDYYSFSVIPAVGELVTGDRNSYQYLVESIRRFPSQDVFASMIADAGFQKVEYENLIGGVVAIHSGLKI